MRRKAHVVDGWGLQVPGGIYEAEEVRHFVLPSLLLSPMATFKEASNNGGSLGMPR